MVVTFRHRGLKRLYTHGDPSKIRPDMVEKIRTILGHLDDSRIIQDMRVPGLRLHALKGELEGHWAVTVNANWRVTFRFEGGHAYDLDLADYH